MDMPLLKILFWCAACSQLFALSNEAALGTTEDETPSDNDVLVVRLSSTHGDRSKLVVMKKGKSLQLLCEFPAKPWSFLQWEKYIVDSFRSSLIQTSRTYVKGSDNVYTSIDLSKVTGEDTGNYSCVSSNAAGRTALEFYVAIKDEGKLYCDDGLCQPNGRCQELINGYKCRCNPGFIGDTCQMTDPCFENPCRNNGSCEAIDGEGFNCTCNEGFAGSTCEREVCLPTSCNNGGNCSETDDGKIQCNCTYNRAGKKCEHACTFRRSLVTDYSYGYRRSCRYSITCIIDAKGVERCRCENRIAGNRCMLESDLRNECTDPHICSGRGSCVDYNYKYKCDCNRYASGKNCEFYNECRARYNACSKYGGTCVDLVQGYECINCPNGQTGDRCQYQEKPCGVQCLESFMIAKCDMRFLPTNLRTSQIYLNSKRRDCVFNQRNSGNYGFVSKKVYYSQCGTKVLYDDNYVVYQNSIEAGVFNTTDKPNDLITRISGYFRFDMKCKIPLKLNETVKWISDKSLDRNISLHLSDEHKVALPTYVTFYNEQWNRITDYVVGDRLFVQLQLRDSMTNHLLLDHGILHASTCYATPDEEGKKLRYVLLENGCIKDSTFRFEEGISRTYRHRVRFSFQSFSFKPDEPPTNFSSSFRSSSKASKPLLYLHCDARFCLKNTEDENVGLKRCSNTCERDTEDDKVDAGLGGLNMEASSKT